MPDALPNAASNPAGTLPADPHVPLMSVLMPVFNCERYVRAALQSILGQSCGDFELIVIDDGSRDRTPEILQEYAQQDSRVCILTRPNRGIVASLNEGIDRACGEFIARMDGDDIALPVRFARQVQFLRNQPACVAVGSCVMLIDSEGEPIRTMCEQLTHEEIDQAHLSGDSHAISHPAVVMRTSAVRAVGGYRKEYEHAEDLDLFLRLAEVGQLANLPDVLLMYRVHAASIGATRRSLQAQRAWAAVCDAHQRRGISMPADAEPDIDRAASLSQQHRKWAWWALAGGHTSTARKHALRAVRGQPLTPESWRLLYCAIRGH
jgi:glycosyltransferase involved in cell wall biosynthesis